MERPLWLLSTLLGLEDLLARELEARGAEVLGVRPSRVLARLDAMPETRLASATSRVFSVAKLEDLSTRGVRAALRSIFKGSEELRGMLSGEVRVKAKAEGQLSARQLSLIAARELKRCYGDVKLDRRAGVVVRCELVGGELVVGVDVARDLHRRGYTVFRHPAMLNPIAAYAMALEAELSEGSLIEDPFCGGATIPIEACMATGAQAIAFDVNPGYVKGASMNVDASGLGGSIEVVHSSIRRPPSKASSIDAILTDPPRGRRLTARRLAQLYRALIAHAEDALIHGGRLVVATDRPRLVLRLMRRSKLRLVRSRFVLTGGVKLRIMVLSLS